MHILAITLICFIVPDSYISQVTFLGVYLYLVLSLWLRQYVRLPLIAMGSYLVLQSVTMPMDPALGWFAPKEVVFWTVCLGAAWAMLKASGGRTKNIWGQSFPWILVALTIAGKAIDGRTVITNTSLNAAMLVAVYPLTSLAAQLAIVTACVFFGTGTSRMLMMPVVALVHGAWGLVVSASALLSGFVWYVLDSDRFSEPGRLAFWKGSWHFMQDKVSLWFGSGLGSMLFYGPRIQKAIQLVEPDGGVWLSMHNDWLQWFFETGIVGVVLLLWLLADCLKRLPMEERLTTLSLCVLGACYFPMDVPLFQLLMACLVVQGQSRYLVTHA